MEEKSLKNQAQDIMVAVDYDLQQLDPRKTAATLAEVDSKANALMQTIFNVVSDVDLEAAVKRVEAFKEKFPAASSPELSQILIREKCQRTGTVGAVTSSAGLIPGLGTAAALTLGVAADIGATFKLQAELVLEMAAVYNYPLTEQEKQQLVLLITGVSAGTSALTRRAGQAVAVRIGEKVAERAIRKSVLKALPVVGVIASAGTNILSTYVIGQRADAYFRLGPEAVGSWSDSVRAITGVDERKIGSWLAESSKVAGGVLSTGVGKVGVVGKTAGEVVVAGAGKVAESATAGAQKAGQTAQVGFRAYFRWVVSFWTAVFRFLVKILGFIWLVISFVPVKIIDLFKRSDKQAADRIKNGG